MDDSGAILALRKMFETFLRDTMCLRACAERDGDTDVEDQIRAFIDAISAAHDVCLQADLDRQPVPERRPLILPSVSIH